MSPQQLIQGSESQPACQRPSMEDGSTGHPSPVAAYSCIGLGFFIGVSVHSWDEHLPGTGWERRQRVKFKGEIKGLRVPQHFPGLYPEGFKAAGPYGHLGASWMAGSSQPALKY